MHNFTPIRKRCHICGLGIPLSLGHNLWCHYCQSYIEDDTPRCPSCALPILNEQCFSEQCFSEQYFSKQHLSKPPLNEPPVCGECLKLPPPWQRMFCLGDYQFPLSLFIQKIKHQRQFWLLPPLIEQLHQRIPDPAPMLISVPMIWHQELWRGFNLSHLMAKQMHALWPSSHLGEHIFHKRMNTPTQKSLNRQARLNNVGKAFTLQNAPTAKHVAIIDDVVTTGATVKHLSQLLLEVGVEKIDIYCLCRTPN
ncbi:phosphoribosyltransferase family protein [Vibrio methylphosphonaticus]|uniref:phosphoribosyltransferase family protein n=1 Tax=Vibrio methylphosphonaticus TaxID=2946866 RepID=UPI002029CA37|nr:phosphoribosyltransferase family protein [Vibrio methylphosphonaticus]MCL9776445.1 ComF family protein [Vibrio methylphosphonaticus]